VIPKGKSGEHPILQELHSALANTQNNQTPYLRTTRKRVEAKIADTVAEVKRG